MMRTTAAAHQLEPRVPAPVAAVRDLRHEIKHERRMQLELLEAASRLSQEEEEEEEEEKEGKSCQPPLLLRRSPVVT